jgi:hypothetical protein
MRIKNGSNLFALACLLGTVWASIATSTANSFYGVYSVKSDCVTPTVDTVVTISNSQITSGGDYTTLGFPTNSLTLGVSNSGVFNGANRVCENTLKEEGLDDSFLYTCSDNGQFTCNIYFSSRD